MRKYNSNTASFQLPAPQGYAPRILHPQPSLGGGVGRWNACVIIIDHSSMGGTWGRYVRGCVWASVGKRDCACAPPLKKISPSNKREGKAERDPADKYATRWSSKNIPSPLPPPLYGTTAWADADGLKMQCQCMEYPVLL